MTPDNTSHPEYGPGSLSGKTALVTGGARRIGRHLVRALVDQGVAVVIHYRQSADEATAAVEEIRAAGGHAWSLTANLADPMAAIELMGRATLLADRPMDILVNNASVFEQGGLDQTDPDKWARAQNINLRAPYFLSKYFARQLPEDSQGNIINMNDFRASRPGADHFAYTVSKVGLQGMTRSLALGLAPRIRVNELALGAVLPPEGVTGDYVHSLKENIPTRMFPSLDEVTRALLFLLENPSLTGQTLSIDGGRHLT
jgi:NAD(P)-dependent dehydrogenase (short-subunit alcohol dehydrogenase family)